MTWFQWWDNRRSHVFPAFSRKNTPATNLAEVIHSKWKTTAGEHLSLVDAAADDIKESLLLERQFKSYEAGHFAGGSGPSVSTMTSRNFQAQNNRAEMYAKDLIEEDPSDLSSRADEVDPLASHRATKPTKRKNKSVNLHENDESKQVLLKTNK